MLIPGLMVDEIRLVTVDDSLQVRVVTWYKMDRVTPDETANISYQRFDIVGCTNEPCLSG